MMALVPVYIMLEEFEVTPMMETEHDWILTDEAAWEALAAAEDKIARAEQIGEFLENREHDDQDSLGRIIEENAREYPDRPAVLYADVKYTYREFNEWANRYAQYLLSRGIRYGNIVVVMLENRPEIMVVIVALAKIGAVASLINTSQRSTVLSHSLTIEPARGFIVGEECLEEFEKVRPSLDFSGNKSFFYIPDSSDTKPPEIYIDLSAAAIGMQSTNPTTTGEVRLKDPVAFIFTSGTTGLPKAAIITHMHATASAYWWGRVILEMTPEDVMYITLPMFHSNAFNIGWASAIAGGSAVALRRKFSASEFWRDTRKFNATAFNYIGEICRYLMNQPPQPDDADNPVCKIAGNGMNVDIWKDFKKRFAIEKVYEQYGATEFMFSLVNFFNLDCTIGTSNRPFAIVKKNPENDEPLRDKNGLLKRVEVGEAGLMLIEIDDPLIFKGYTDDQSTEKKIIRDAFAPGDMWANTGDVLRDIGHNHAQFVDRLGDTFRWKSENVSTDEVANIVIGFQPVLQAAVYGVTVPQTDGRAGMAAIVASTGPDHFDLAGLATYLRASLPAYAVPIFLRLMQRLETTSTHKIRKNILQKQGFAPAAVTDPMYVLLPGASTYTPLTPEVYQDVMRGRFKF
jgi:citronellyl-CoA synthetase